ncbi:MAG: hypothetical protein ACRDH7_07615 [Actinomycetota bacterium]
MSRVARYGKAVAREGCGEQLAALLLIVAETFADDVMALVDDWEMIELDLLGGKG